MHFNFFHLKCSYEGFYYANVWGLERDIDMLGGVVLELDMKINKGEEESEDVQLIDGASYFC